MSQSIVINKSAMSRLKEHAPFAKSIYQAIVDEWLLETINVKKAKSDLKEMDKLNRKKVQCYRLSPKEIMKRTYETYQTHTFAIPSIGLYLFPQSKEPFHFLFKSTPELFQVGNLMVNLRANSDILPKMTNLFYEHGLIVSSDVSRTGELLVKVHHKEEA